MPPKPGNHFERLPAAAVAATSDRAFGLAFGAAFSMIGLLPLAFGGPARLWSLALAGALLFTALIDPRLLAPLNRVWTRLGLLQRVLTPLLMGLLFYGVVTPTGLALRLAGKDVLDRRFDREADSYWIRRDPAGPPPDTMTRQF